MRRSLRPPSTPGYDQTHSTSLLASFSTVGETVTHTHTHTHNILPIRNAAWSSGADIVHVRTCACHVWSVFHHFSPAPPLSVWLGSELWPCPVNRHLTSGRLERQQQLYPIPRWQTVVRLLCSFNHVIWQAFYMLRTLIQRLALEAETEAFDNSEEEELS